MARRDSWHNAMRASESGRPLLMNGSRTIDTDEFEAIEMRGLDDPINKTLEDREARKRLNPNAYCWDGNLDRSMQVTVGLDFDNSCFADHKKQIDYVLAYEEEDEAATAQSVNGEETDAQKRAGRRKHFEENLRRMGLELTEVATDPTDNESNPNQTPKHINWAPRSRIEERCSCLPLLREFITETMAGMQLVGRTHYILVHAPFSVLERQAQLLNVKLPVKKCDVESSGRALMPGCLDRCLDKMRFLDFDDDLKEQLEEPDYYSAIYSAENRQKFVLWDKPEYMFPSSERSRLVYDLLVRARYRKETKDKNDTEKHRVGIERLVGNGTYTGAYPLHQQLRSRAEMEADTNVNGRNQRELLYTCWASWRNVGKYQPLDLIKRYFGSKIGLYFAWLGYYTKTLYPAAFIGLCCFFFGWTQFGDDDVSTDVCHANTTYQCPLCTGYCSVEPLSKSCFKAQVTYLFDNAATVVFAALMSVWASLFLEGWKRYHAEVAWKWGLLDFAVEEDLVRPEFQYRVNTTKYNPITKKAEPYLTSKKKCFNFIASGVTVLFFIFLVMGVVFGMVVYRSIMMGLMQQQEYESNTSFYVVNITAALLNLIVILIMNYVYYFLALILTRWECPRTQNDFDNSFTIKVFLFQFVNYYSSLFYVAFFKGLLSQLPTFQYRDDKNVLRTGGALTINGTQLDSCDAVGCFDELVIQLAIIMCGRQFFSGFVELGYPFIMKLIRQWQFLVPASKRERNAKEEKLGEIGAKRWEEDYFLSPTYEQWLFDEYLEMVIQFGFITLFVAAFPLAPLFALVNNIMEIRMDAYKFLVSTQRPMPAQSRNIGIWLQILQFLSNISVTVNAFVIAFTSDFVPRSYYKWTHKGNLKGYLEWSLSHFDASKIKSANKTLADSVTDCRFRGFRKIPCTVYNASPTVDFLGINKTYYTECEENNSYSYSEDFWKVFVMRLAFVVVFEHVVFLIKTIVDYLIPDVPTKIFVQQQREKYLLRKAALEDINSRQGSIREGHRRKTATSSDVNEVAFQPGEFGADCGIIVEE